MAGVASSRIVASSRRPVTEPAKASAVNSNKSHALETKGGGKPGKSRPSDVKKNTIPEVKSKENDTGKGKVANKTGVKPPVPKVSSLCPFCHVYFNRIT